MALVIGTVASYLQRPKAIRGCCFRRVGLVVLAMVLSALAYRKLPRKAGAQRARIGFRHRGGCLMGIVLSPANVFHLSGLQHVLGSGGHLTPYTGILLSDAASF